MTVEAGLNLLSSYEKVFQTLLQFWAEKTQN
jgi:hypothetical protein